MRALVDLFDIKDFWALSDGQIFILDNQNQGFTTRDIAKTWRLDTLFKEKMKVKNDNNIKINDSLTILNVVVQDENHSFVQGQRDDELFFTTDNWATSSKIATPFTQGKLKLKKVYLPINNEKLMIWQDFLIIKQRGQVFYSKIKTMDWQIFPNNLIDLVLV